MLESVASRVLKRYASAFVEEVRPEDLTLGVLDGVVELRDVRLKPAAVESLSLPVVVESATASFVRLKFPWRALGAEPVEITLAGLALRVRTKAAADAPQSRVPDSTAARDAAHSAKMVRRGPWARASPLRGSHPACLTREHGGGLQAALAQLHAAEQAVRSAGAAQGPGTGARSPSLLARPLAWAAHRTHIRVRDVVADVRHVCASGAELRVRASLDSLALEPAGRGDLSESWFVDGTVAAADAGAVLATMAKVDGLALRAGVAEGPPPEWDALPAVLEPWGVECVVAVCNPMVSAPPPTVGGVGIRVRLLARAAPMAISLRRSQLPALIDAATAVASYQQHCIEWRRRPPQRPGAGPSARRAWWRYAARAARRHPLHLCPHPRPPCKSCREGSGGDGRAFAGRAARYRTLFLARERGTPPLSEADATEARDLEVTLPLEALARAQHEAQEVLEQERKTPTEGPAAGSRAAWAWLARWFGGGGDAGGGVEEDSEGDTATVPAPPPAAVAVAGRVVPFLASLGADGVDVLVEDDAERGGSPTPLLRLRVGRVEACVAQRDGCTPHASLGVAALEAEACERRDAAVSWQPLLRVGRAASVGLHAEAVPTPYSASAAASVDALAAFLAGRLPAEEGRDPLTVALLPEGKMRLRAHPLSITPSLPWLARAGAFVGPHPASAPSAEAAAAGASASASVVDAVERVRAARAGAASAGVRRGLDQARQRDVEAEVGGLVVSVRANTGVESPRVVLRSGRIALHRGAGERCPASAALAASTCDPWRARLSVPALLSVAALTVAVEDGLAPDAGEVPTPRPPSPPLGILVPPSRSVRPTGLHSSAAGTGRESPSRRRRVQWRPAPELENEVGPAPAAAQQPAARRVQQPSGPSGELVEPLDATILLLAPAGDGVEGLPGCTVAARLSPVCATFCAHRRGLVDRWVQAASTSAAQPDTAAAAAAASTECAAERARAALLPRLLSLPRGAAAVAWPSLSLSLSLPLIQGRLIEQGQAEASELASFSLRDLRAVYSAAAVGVEAALSIGDLSAQACLPGRGPHRVLHLAPSRPVSSRGSCPPQLRPANGAQSPLQRGAAAVWTVPDGCDGSGGGREALPAAVFVQVRHAAAPGIGLASHAAAEGQSGDQGADMSLVCAAGSLHANAPCHLLARVARAATAPDSALATAPGPTGEESTPPLPPQTPPQTPPRPLCARVDLGVQLASARFAAADPSGAAIVTASLHALRARHTAWERGSRTSAQLRCVDVRPPDSASGSRSVVAVDGGGAADSALTACVEEGRVPSSVTAFRPGGDTESRDSVLAPPLRVKAALGRVALEYRAAVVGDVVVWAAEVASDPREQPPSPPPAPPPPLAPNSAEGPPALPALELTVAEVEARVPCSSGRQLKRSAVVVALRNVACATRTTRAMAHFRARDEARGAPGDDRQGAGWGSEHESRLTSRATSPAASLASSAGSTVFEDAMEDVVAGWASDGDDEGDGRGVQLPRFSARSNSDATSEEGSDFEEAGLRAGVGVAPSAAAASQWFPARLSSDCASAATTLEASLDVSVRTETLPGAGIDASGSGYLLAPVQARATLRQVLDLGAARVSALLTLDGALDVCLSQQQLLLLSALSSHNLAEQGPLVAALAARAPPSAVPPPLTRPATVRGGGSALGLATARQWASECGPAGPMDAPNCVEVDVPGLSVRLCRGAGEEPAWRLHAGRVSACHRSGPTRASSTAALSALGLDRCHSGGDVSTAWVEPAPAEDLAASVTYHTHVRGEGSAQRSATAVNASVGVLRLEAGPEAAALGAFFDPDPALLPGLDQEPAVPTVAVPAPAAAAGTNEEGEGEEAVSSFSASIAGLRARMLVPSPSERGPCNRLPCALLLRTEVARASAVLAPRGVTAMTAALPGVSVVALTRSDEGRRLRSESVLRPWGAHVRAAADLDPVQGVDAVAKLEARVESPRPLVVRLSLRQLVAIQRYAALVGDASKSPLRDGGESHHQPSCAATADVTAGGEIAPRNPRPFALDSSFAPVFLTVVNDAGEGPVPLLQARLSRVRATARGDHAFQRLTASCSLAADVHEPKACRWEPLVEPWALSVSRCERFGDPVDWLTQAEPRTAAGSSNSFGRSDEVPGGGEGSEGDEGNEASGGAGFLSGDDFDALRSPPAVTLLAKAHNVADVTVATTTANALLAASAELAALQRAAMPVKEEEEEEEVGAGATLELPSSLDALRDGSVGASVGREEDGDTGVTLLHNCLGRAVAFREVVDWGTDGVEWPAGDVGSAQAPTSLRGSSASEQEGPGARAPPVGGDASASTAAWRQVQDGARAALTCPAHARALAPEACRAAAARVATLCGAGEDGAEAAAAAGACDPVHDADLAWHVSAAQGTLGGGETSPLPRVLLLSVEAGTKPLAVRVGRTGVFAYRVAPQGGRGTREADAVAAGAGGAVVVEVATEAGARIVRVRSRLALRNCTAHPLQVRLWEGESAGRKALARCWNAAVSAWRTPMPATGDPSEATGGENGDRGCMERTVPAGGELSVPAARLAETWMQLRPRGGEAVRVQWSVPLPCATLVGAPRAGPEERAQSPLRHVDGLPQPQQPLASPHFLVGCPAEASGATPPWYAVGYRAAGRQALAALRATDATTVGESVPSAGESGAEQEDAVTPLLSVLALVPPCAVDNTLPTQLVARVMRHHPRGGRGRDLARHVHEGGLASRGLLRLDCGELGSLHSLPPPGWAEAHAAAAIAAATSLRRWAARHVQAAPRDPGPVPDRVLPLLYPLSGGAGKGRRRHAKEEFSEVLHACISAESVHGVRCAADAVLDGEVLLPPVQGGGSPGADAAAWGRVQRRICLGVGPGDDGRRRPPFSVGLSVEGVRTAAGTLLLRVAAPAWVVAHGAAAGTDGHTLLVAEDSSAGRATAEAVAAWSGAGDGAGPEPEAEWLLRPPPTAARILPMADPIAPRPPPVVAAMVAGPGSGEVERRRVGRWSPPFSRVAVGAAATVLLRPDAPLREGETPFCVHATASVHMGPGKFSGSRIVRLAPRVLVANRAGQPLWVAAGREAGGGQALAAGEEAGWVSRGPEAEEGVAARLCVAPDPEGPWSQPVGLDVGQDATLALPRTSVWRPAQRGWVTELGPMAPPAAAGGRVGSARLEDAHTLLRLAMATDGATQVLAIHGHRPASAPYRVLNETLGFSLRVRQAGAPLEHAVQVSPTEDAEWCWHDPGQGRTVLVALEPWGAPDEEAATAVCAATGRGDAAPASPALNVLGAASAASGVLRTLAAVPGARRGGDEDVGEVAVALDEAGSETRVEAGARSAGTTTTVRLQVRVVGAARVLVATETRTPPGLVIPGGSGDGSRRLVDTAGWPAHRCADLLRGDAAALLARPALRHALLGVASRSAGQGSEERERMAGAVAVGASASALWMRRERSRALEGGSPHGAGGDDGPALCEGGEVAGEESAWAGILADVLRTTGVSDLVLPLNATTAHSLDALRHAGASGPDALLAQLRTLRTYLQRRFEAALAGSRALAYALEDEEKGEGGGEEEEKEERGGAGASVSDTVFSVLAVRGWDLPGSETRLRLRIVHATTEGASGAGHAWPAQTRAARGSRAPRWMERMHLAVGRAASLGGAALEGEVVDTGMGGRTRPLGSFCLDASTLATQAAAAQRRGGSLAFTVALATVGRAANARKSVPGPGPRVGLIVGTYPSVDIARHAVRRHAMLVALRRSCALVDALRQRLFLLGVPLGHLVPRAWAGARRPSPPSPLRASPSAPAQLAARGPMPGTAGSVSGRARGPRPLEATLSLRGAQHLPLPVEPARGTPVEGTRCYAAVRMGGLLRRTVPAQPDLSADQAAAVPPRKHFRVNFTARSLGLGLRQTHSGLVVVSRVASDLVARVEAGSAQDAARLQPGCVLTDVRGWDTTCVPMESVVRWLHEQPRPLALGFTEGAAGRRSRSGKGHTTSPTCSVQWGERLSVRPVQGSASAPEVVVTLFVQHPKDATSSLADASARGQLLPLLLFFGEAAAVGADESVGATEALHPRDLLLGQLRIPLPCGPEGAGGCWEGTVALGGPASKWGATVQLSLATRPLQLGGHQTTQSRLCLLLPGLSVTLLGRDGREVIHAGVRGARLRSDRTAAGRSMDEVEVDSVQVDDQRADAVLPTVLRSLRPQREGSGEEGDCGWGDHTEGPSPFAATGEDASDEATQHHPFSLSRARDKPEAARSRTLHLVPTLHASAVRLDQAAATHVEMLSVLLQELCVEADVAFLLRLVGVLQEIRWDAAATEGGSTPQRALTTAMGQAPLGPRVALDVPEAEAPGLYVGVLQLQPIKLTVTVAGDVEGGISALVLPPSPALAPLRAVLDAAGAMLAQVDAAPLRVKALLAEHVCGRGEEVVGRVTRHLTSQLVREAYKVLASAEFLGNPVGLVTGVGAGVVDFFYEPAQGMLENPRDFGRGFTRGTTRLVAATAGAVLHSAASLAGTVNRGVASLAMDEEWARERRQAARGPGPRNVGAGLSAGRESLQRGLWSGVKGVVMDPVRGARRDGARGAAQGVARGLLGALVKPTSGILDLTTHTLRGLRNTGGWAPGSGEGTGRLRLPRYAGAVPAPQPYRPGDAMGAALTLLVGMRGGELYVWHWRDEASDAVLLLTSRRVVLLDLGAGSALWAAPTNCCTASRRGQHLTVERVKPGAGLAAALPTLEAAFQDAPAASRPRRGSSSSNAAFYRDERGRGAACLVLPSTRAARAAAALLQVAVGLPGPGQLEAARSAMHAVESAGAMVERWGATRRSVVDRASAPGRTGAAQGPHPADEGGSATAAVLHRGVMDWLCGSGELRVIGARVRGWELRHEQSRGLLGLGSGARDFVAYELAFTAEAGSAGWMVEWSVLRRFRHARALFLAVAAAARAERSSFPPPSVPGRRLAGSASHDVADLRAGVISAWLAWLVQLVREHGRFPNAPQQPADPRDVATFLTDCAFDVTEQPGNA